MPNKTTSINLRIEESLHNGIEALADAKGVSIGAFARDILKRSLRSHKQIAQSQP